MKEKTVQFENKIQSLNTRLEEKSKASKSIQVLSKSCTGFKKLGSN